MADEQPLLHVDSDWKKQAQEEKRKLAEAAAASKTAAPTPAVKPVLADGSSPASTGTAPKRSTRNMPVPGFPSLVQSVMTQILYYLGELPASGGQASIDLDLAKHHLDVLSVLEEKTRNNLSADEQTTLDGALYETRTRFVNVASQYLGP